MNLFTQKFWDLGLRTIKELETDQGILASGREELYGCIFGRDSLITALILLDVHKKKHEPEFLDLVRKILLNQVLLMGKEENLESGEQPGKAIHEFRPSKHEHLTKREHRPWYLYADQVMRNYDSVDATPLLLIALYRFWQISGDGFFINQVLPAVNAGFDWLDKYSDSNKDGLIDYELSNSRQSGGLVTQNWMDSVESVFHETGEDLIYPLAPVEVQAYAYLAYRLWADYFQQSDPDKSDNLNQKADRLKKVFNKKYPTEDPDGNFYFAFKIDGRGTPFRAVRSNMGHVLWASTSKHDDGRVDSILTKGRAESVVRRLMMPDMFEPKAGIRTLSKLSSKFKPNSYHNGSIWPHDNALIAEGFEIHGFTKEARMVRDATLSAIEKFNSAIELFVYEENKYSEYSSIWGQSSCKNQAWSAAAILDAAVS
jgi:glycogen debranching enzyme